MPHKGYKHTPETLAKMSAAHRGHLTTLEHRAKISGALRGIKRGPFSPEHRSKLSQAKRGIHLSTETCAKMRGRIPWNKGKHHSKKTKQKLSESTTKWYQENPGARRGENHPGWKGGKIKTRHGYFLIWKPTHIYAGNKGYVKESRLIMENILGRYLNPNEVVHHENGKREDDRPENLKLFESRGKHMSFHLEKRRET